MKNLKVLPITMFALLLCAALVPGVRASESDKRTIVTFSDSVEIPGQVLEPEPTFLNCSIPIQPKHRAGLERDEDQLLATIQTISDYKPHVDDKSIFYLGPLSSDSTWRFSLGSILEKHLGEDSSIAIPDNDQATRPNRAR